MRNRIISICSPIFCIVLYCLIKLWTNAVSHYLPNTQTRLLHDTIAAPINYELELYWLKSLGWACSIIPYLFGMSVVGGRGWGRVAASRRRGS